jgi:hypothetical protein
MVLFVTDFYLPCPIKTKRSINIVSYAVFSIEPVGSALMMSIYNGYLFNTAQSTMTIGSYRKTCAPPSNQATDKGNSKLKSHPCTCLKHTKSIKKNIEV